MTEIYDSIGTTYTTTRRADLQIEQAIWSAFGYCGSVLNVGAGTGAAPEGARRRDQRVQPGRVNCL